MEISVYVGYGLWIGARLYSFCSQILVMSVWTTFVPAFVYVKVFAFFDFLKSTSTVGTEECRASLRTFWRSLKATYLASDLVEGFVS
ncbi:MAG: hypothetical protein ACW97O_14900 [Candidatus Thorarchaeota archaeon]